MARQAPRFERQDFFQASPVDTSAAQVATGLAQALNTFGNVSSAIGQEAHRVQVETDKLAINAASIDIEDQIDYAKGLYGDDVELFEQLVTQSSNGTVSAMDERLRGGTLGSVKKYFGDALTEVKLAQHQRFVDQGIVESGKVQELATIDGANAARNNDLEGVEVARERLLNALPEQLFSPEQIQSQTDTFNKEVAEQAVIGMGIKTYEDEGAVAAFSAIQNFEENGVPGVAPDEVSRVAGEVREILNTKIATQNKTNDRNDKLTKAWQQANSEELLVQASGASETPQVQEMVLADAKVALRKGHINFKQFNTIRTEINAPDGIDNLSAMEEIQAKIYQNFSKPEVEDLISLYRGKGNLTSTKANELRAENAKRSGLPPTPFELQRSQAYTFLTETLKDSSIFSKYDENRAARFANAVDEFNQLIPTAEVDGIAPMAITKDLVDRYRLAPLTLSAFANPRFGSKDDLDAAEDATLDAMDSGEISQALADYELGLIEELRTVKARGDTNAQ